MRLTSRQAEAAKNALDNLMVRADVFREVAGVDEPKTLFKWEAEALFRLRAMLILTADDDGSSSSEVAR